MKKWLVSVVLMLMCLVLGACGGAKEDYSYEIFIPAVGDASNELQFEKNVFGDIVVTGYGSFQGNELVIPATMPDGSNVCGIAARALEYYDELERVAYINKNSGSVFSVGGDALFSCDGLKEVVIVSETIILESESLSYLNGIESVTLIGKNIQIGYSAFINDDRLEKVHIYGMSEQDNFTLVLNEAFEFCDALSEISFPSGTVSIGEEAFYGSDALKEVVFGKGKISINKDAFNGCDATPEITYKGQTYSVGNIVLASVDVYSSFSATAKKIIGRWEIEGAIYNDKFYSLEDLKAMGDDSMDGTYMEFKDNGTVYICSEGESELIDWQPTISGVTIGKGECKLHNGKLYLVSHGAIVFNKVSE